MKKFIIAGLMMGVSAIVAQAATAETSWDSVVAYSEMPNPKGVDPQIGALGTLPNGDLIAAFHRGEIMVYSGKEWKPWGEGLHEPLGMHVENQHSIVVVQRAELTRITDTDKDGSADNYETLCAGWGMTGNYHEFAFGAEKGPDGQFYVALGTASNNGGTRPEIRGVWNDAGGITHAETTPNWKSGRQKKLPRMFARVPYRGSVIKVDPKNGKITPFASGLRTPHGVHVNAKGELYINDNQGDWLGSSKLYKIEQGKFYGHADSLIWRDGWDRGTPANLKAAELEKLRSKSVCFLPQGDLANSPTQILTLPEKGFGPYGGDIIMGEMNQPRLVRYLPDVVNGLQQGAVMKFYEHTKLGRGNAKLTVGDDGSLYVGKTHLSWAGGSGIVRLKYLEKEHLAVKAVELTSSGFKVTLNGDVDPKQKIQIAGNHYGLHYHSKYGSPKVNPTALKLKSVEVSGKTVHIRLAEPLLAGQIYDVAISGVQSTTLGKLLEPRFFYTAHEVIAHVPQVFAFENAYRRKKVEMNKQVEQLHKFGFDGIGSMSEGGAIEKLDAYAKAKVKVFSVYGGGTVTETGYVFDRVNYQAIIEKLKNTDTVLEFYIKGPRGDNKAAHTQAVMMMQELADMAKPAGLKVVLYPHSGQFVVATITEAVEIAKLTKRDNVGVMFNLCHFLKEQPKANLRNELENAVPYLWAVSVSGASQGGSSWGELIRPLGEGDYDLAPLFEILKKIRFKGNVGLQCYALKGEPESYLSVSGLALKKLIPRERKKNK